MNKFFNRPLAPHLTIYSLQGSSLFSIWHRISAVFLVLLVIFFLLLQKFFLWLSYSSTLHNTTYLLWQITNMYTIFVVYTIVLYHMINGLRHILWDLNFLLSNKDVTKTNIAVVLLLVILQILSYKNFLL